MSNILIFLFVVTLSVIMYTVFCNDYSEHLTNTEALQNVALIYKSQNMTVSNLKSTGDVNINDTTNIDSKGNLNTKNITTDNITTNNMTTQQKITADTIEAKNNGIFKNIRIGETTTANNVSAANLKILDGSADKYFYIGNGKLGYAYVTPAGIKSKFEINKDMNITSPEFTWTEAIKGTPEGRRLKTYGNYNADNADKCKQACGLNPMCTHIVTTKSDKTCRLHGPVNVTDTDKEYNHKSTYIKKLDDTRVKPSYKIYDGYDWMEYNRDKRKYKLRDVRHEKTIDECKTMCSDTPECMGFVVEANDNTQDVNFGKVGCTPKMNDDLPWKTHSNDTTFFKKYY